MAGGLIQLVTYGTQDIFLTGTPQITFFKMVYRKYTNFSIEAVEQSFNGFIDFGKTVSCKIEKNADLMNRVYLEVILPEVQLEKIKLNPEYAPPTSTSITQGFRPDDIEYIDRLSNKKNAQALFLTFKILIDYLMDAYRYSLQEINKNVDLDIKKNINDVYPDGSFANSLFNDFFDEITVDLNISKLLVSYYVTNLQLTSNDLTILNNFSITGKISYSYYVNFIKNVLYTSSIDYVFPEICFQKIELKSIFQNFFDTTVDEVLDDDEREKIILDILNQWFIDINYSYNFLEKQYKQSCIEFNKIITPYVKFAWIKRIGHFIIDYAELLIGGKRIDKQYGDWMNIWYELSRNVYQEENYNKMIGDIDYLTSFDANLKPQYKLYIPLQFWFCRHNGLSIPLVALRYHDVQINIKFRKLEECAYIESGYSLFDSLHIDNASLFVDYIYLDNLERKRFARASHEYLIEQIQREQFDDIISNKHTVELNFVHPCKELIWVLQKKKYLINPTDDNQLLNRNNYSCNDNGKNNPIINSKLEFNTYSRIEKIDGTYFNYVQPYQSHTHTPKDGINVYSFAIHPELHQPSGTANLSRVDYIIMNMLFDDKIIEELTKEGIILSFYTVNYNVLRIMSGMAGIAFSS
jgi:hypothetical protein